MPGAGGGGRSPTAPFAPLLPTVLRLHLMPAGANGRLALQGQTAGDGARMQQAPFVCALWLLRCMRYEACSIAILRHIARVSLLSAYLHIISHRYSLYLLSLLSVHCKTPKCSHPNPRVLFLLVNIFRLCLPCAVRNGP